MNILQEIRFGYRMWRKAPGITLVTVFSLGLAIAACTTMFALAAGLLYQPLPFVDQEHLMLVERFEIGDIEPGSGGQISPPDFLDMQASLTTFSELCAFDDEPYVVSDFDEPQAILMTTVSANLFEVLGVEPLLGRVSSGGEGQVDENVLILDHRYWQDQFDGDRDVLGATLTLNQVPHIVIGVLPEEFNLLTGSYAAYLPTDFAGYDNRGNNDFLVLGRLAEGVSIEEARAELTVFAAGLEQEYLDTHEGMTVSAARLRAVVPGRTDTLLITMAMVVCILGLLIASANIANLLLSKAGTRMKEVAVRITLGASRFGLFRQFLVESLLLSLTAGLVGIVLALWAVPIFRSSFPPDIPPMFLPRIDGGVLLATVAISIVAGLVFGLAPALFASIKDVRGALNDGGRGGTIGRRWRRVRHAFVIGEVAIALGVLAGAGLITNLFSSVINPEPGFEQEGLLGFELALPDYRYPDDAALLRFHREMIPALESIPGVEGVAVMNNLPRTRDYSSTTFQLSGQTFEDDSDLPTTGWTAANAEYLSAMRGQLLAGRFLGRSDTADGRPVAVVNQTFVDQFLEGEEPIGASMEMLGASREIVGVIANICQERIPDEWTIDPMVYIPLEHYPLRFPSVALRSTVDRGTIAGATRQAIWGIDPYQPVDRILPYEDYFMESLGPASVFGDFLFVLCCMAVFLAAMGIFGIISHAVLLRRREIGIRISVGARAGQVVGLITRQGIWLAVKGFILGAPLVFLMSRAVRSIFEFGEARLPVEGYSTILLLVIFALLASWLPARRAARIQPVDALNAE